jgi:drug/metabolite transporter (DMT)-like permease
MGKACRSNVSACTEVWLRHDHRMATESEAAVAVGTPAHDESPREAALAGLAALVTVVLWASAFVGIRAAGEDFSPGPLALGRLVIGSLILGLFVLARRESLPRARDLPGIVVCGLLWFGLYNVALNAGEQRVDAGTAAMLVAVGPIVLALLAGVLLGEGFPRQLLLGCAVAFVGVAVIGLAVSEASRSSAGVLLCLLAAVAYASGVVAQKFPLRHVSALQTTFLCCLVGALACLPFAPSLVDELPDSPASSVAWVVYLGALPTALAFTTWAYALARTSAGRLGATTYLAPPISVLLGWAILAESPPRLALAGGGLCLLGVALSRR